MNINRMDNLRYLFFSVFILVFSLDLFSQQGSCVILELKNGYSVKGTLVESVNESYVKILTKSGQEITYPYSDISAQYPCNKDVSSQLARFKLMAGPIIGIGTSQKTLGIGIKGQAELKNKLVFSPSIIYFFSGSKTVEMSSSYLGDNNYSTYDIDISVPSQICLDLDLNYHFYETGLFKCYALGGLELLYGSEFISDDGQWYQYPHYDNKGLHLGLNIGGGLSYSFSDRFLGVSELKYTIGGTEQLTLTAGFLLKI